MVVWGGGGRDEGASRLSGSVFLYSCTLVPTFEIKVAKVVVPDRVALSVLTKEATGEALPKNLSRIEGPHKH